MGFPGCSDGKESAWNMWDLGFIPDLGRSPGEGNRNPLQYSGLENSMDRGAWQVTVYRVIKNWTWLIDFHLLTHLYVLYFTLKGCFYWAENSYFSLIYLKYPPFFLASTFSVEKDVISIISGYFKVIYVIFVLWLIFKFYICFDSQIF